MQSKKPDLDLILPPVGFVLLTLVFVGLKLSGHIDWSWEWVLSPLWAPLALLGLAVLVAVGILIEASKKL